MVACPCGELKCTKTTRNKQPCTCSKNNECKGCTRKSGERLKDLKPHLYVEEPKTLPVPILVTTHQDKTKRHVHLPETIKQSFTSIQQRFFRPEKSSNSIAAWYKKKKALRSLDKLKKEEKKQLQEWEKWNRRERRLIRKTEEDEKKQQEREKKTERQWKKRERQIVNRVRTNEKENRKKLKKQKAIDEKQLENARCEREKEFFEQVLEQQKLKAEIAKNTLKTKHPRSLHKFKTEKVPPPSKPYKTTVPFTPVEEEPVKENTDIYRDYYYAQDTTPIKSKTKTPKAKKPKKEKKTDDKSLNAKPYSASRSVYAKEKKDNKLGKKFINCFYKCCCEFYCWMTLIVGVGLAVILLF